jgi:hypothetical protein
MARFVITAGSDNDSAKQDRKPAAIKSGKETLQRRAEPFFHPGAAQASIDF